MSRTVEIWNIWLLKLEEWFVENRMWGVGGKGSDTDNNVLIDGVDIMRMVYIEQDKGIKRLGDYDE